MKVRELLEALKYIDPESSVRLCLSMPGRVISVHENVWIADYGGGPQLNAALDFRQFHVYVGCGIEQLVAPIPGHEARPRPPVADPSLDLGTYETAEEALRVRDFYIHHRQPEQPLSDPNFDYENWIPPRTTSGQYNERIAEILREKLLKE
jgi:hypothetical protein